MLETQISTLRLQTVQLCAKNSALGVKDFIVMENDTIWYMSTISKDFFYVMTLLVIIGIFELGCVLY